MLYAFAYYILSRVMIMNKTNKRGEGRASFVRHPVFLWRSRRLKLPSFCGPFCRQMHTDATATGCCQGVYREYNHWSCHIYISAGNGPFGQEGQYFQITFFLRNPRIESIFFIFSWTKIKVRPTSVSKIIKQKHDVEKNINFAIKVYFFVSK